jgi:hypothetical protein
MTPGQQEAERFDIIRPAVPRQAGLEKVTIFASAASPGK